MKHYCTLEAHNGVLFTTCDPHECSRIPETCGHWKPVELKDHFWPSNEATCDACENLDSNLCSKCIRMEII